MSSYGKQQKSRSQNNDPTDAYTRAIFSPDDYLEEPFSVRIRKQITKDKDIFKSTASATGIDFEKYQNIPVTCTGDFKPIAAFEEALLPKEVIHNIELAQYKTPTPIQQYAIPVGLAGRDLMGCAQTGSGKTAAFLLPVITRLLKESDKKKKLSTNRIGCPSYLILAPTRELAIQIHKEALKFANGTWIKPVVVYGGAMIVPQCRQLERGVDILVATPGRLMDLMGRNKVSFERVKFLCFDEADRMLDMGFEPDVRRIVLESDMPTDRVTTMFSATFPPAIRALACEFLRNYVHLTVGRIGSTTESITQSIKSVEDNAKKDEIVSDLKLVTGRTLVFCETKRQTENLSRYLFAQGFPASAIHGDREQREREAALTSFKTGRISVLVATDVASRGLDIPEVAHVINYDLPNAIDSYVHRIGRTGRAGNRGLATSYFTSSDGGIVKSLLSLLKESNQIIPEFLLKGKFSKKTKGGGFRGKSKGKKRHMRRDKPW